MHRDQTRSNRKNTIVILAERRASDTQRAGWRQVSRNNRYLATHRRRLSWARDRIRTVAGYICTQCLVEAEIRRNPFATQLAPWFPAVARRRSLVDNLW